MAMSSTEAYFVTRTARALEVLAFGPMSAPQLGAELNVHARTARRMLHRLVEAGFVARIDSPRPRYELTMRVVGVAGQWLEHSALPRLAVPFVRQLHEETGLCAHLVVPAYHRVLCLVHCAEAAGPEPRLRELVPVHCSAGGKALLAERQPWREHLLRRPLPGYTERTITDVVALERETAEIRARGYAVEDGEYREGLRAVAAPVRDDAGEAIAAIGVTSSEAFDVGAVGTHVAETASLLCATLADARRPGVPRLTSSRAT
jgi:DNA-binding IclR family transcriptional regulator